MFEEDCHLALLIFHTFCVLIEFHVWCSSQEEKDKWIEDLNEAIIRAKSRGDEKFRYPSLKSSTSEYNLEQEKQDQAI